MVVMVARLPKLPPDTVPGTIPTDDSLDDESARPTAAATDKFCRRKVAIFSKPPRTT
jgi:hypothetical protein